MLLKEFEYKRVCITGAARGIGRAIVEKLAPVEGIQIVAIARTRKNLDSLKKAFPQIKTVEVDLRNFAETREAVNSFCPIDILINNAGMAKLQPFLEVDQETCDEILDVNLKAVINVSQVVAKSMIKHTIRDGTIVNVSSIASKVALQDHTVYCASKAALDSLTRSMALELGPHNIRVNSVNPTVVMTEMGQMAWSDPKKSGPLLSKTPLNRFSTPEEVVEVILFLAGPKSSMVNGVHIPVDGGFLI